MNLTKVQFGTKIWDNQCFTEYKTRPVQVYSRPTGLELGVNIYREYYVFIDSFYKDVDNYIKYNKINFSPHTKDFWIVV